MGSFAIKVTLSRLKFEAWLAQQMGTKKATLNGPSGAEGALLRFLEETVGRDHGVAIRNVRIDDNTMSADFLNFGSRSNFDKSCRELERFSD